MNTENNKKKVIDSLVKKKIEGLKGVFGGVACTAAPKPRLCWVCTVTSPNPGGSTTGQA